MTSSLQTQLLCGKTNGEGHRSVTSAVVGEHRLRQVYVRCLPLALGLTAVANMVISVFVPVAGQPVRFHEDGSLTHLVHTEQETVARRYGLYLDLGDVASDGVLVVPPDSPVRAELARGLSNVTLVTRVYDPEALSVEAIPTGEPQGLLAAGNGDVPYWIIPGRGDDRWWLARTPEGIVILPESLAPVPGEGS